MKQTIKLSLLFLLVLVFATNVFSTDYSFSRIINGSTIIADMEGEGVFQINAFEIFQNRLWVGTSEGLVHYENLVMVNTQSLNFHFVEYSPTLNTLIYCTKTYCYFAPPNLSPATIFYTSANNSIGDLKIMPLNTYGAIISILDETTEKHFIYPHIQDIINPNYEPVSYHNDCVDGIGSYLNFNFNHYCMLTNGGYALRNGYIDDEFHISIKYFGLSHFDNANTGYVCSNETITKINEENATIVYNTTNCKKVEYDGLKLAYIGNDNNLYYTDDLENYTFAKQTDISDVKQIRFYDSGLYVMTLNDGINDGIYVTDFTSFYDEVVVPPTPNQETNNALSSLPETGIAVTGFFSNVIVGIIPTIFFIAVIVLCVTAVIALGTILISHLKPPKF